TELNRGPLTDLKIVEKLDSMYIALTNLHPTHQKSSLSIWDAYEAFIDEELIQNIQLFIDRNSHIAELIKEKYAKHLFYKESVVLFIFWMLKKHKNSLLNNWPLPLENLDLLASDIGVSIPID